MPVGPSRRRLQDGANSSHRKGPRSVCFLPRRMQPTLDFDATRPPIAWHVGVPRSCETRRTPEIPRERPRPVHRSRGANPMRSAIKGPAAAPHGRPGKSRCCSKSTSQTVDGQVVRRCILRFGLLPPAAGRPVCRTCEAAVRSNPDRRTTVRRTGDARTCTSIRAAVAIVQLTSEVLRHRPLKLNGRRCGVHDEQESELLA